MGRFKRQIGPGIQARIPFGDSVLVVDIRERVSEFKAERMLTKDNVPVSIDAILRYRILEERSKYTILNVQSLLTVIVVLVICELVHWHYVHSRKQHFRDCISNPMNTRII